MHPSALERGLIWNLVSESPEESEVFAMRNIQFYDKDLVLGTTAAAHAVAERLNKEANKKTMKRSWEDVQRSLGSEHEVVGKF